MAQVRRLANVYVLVALFILVLLGTVWTTHRSSADTRDVPTEAEIDARLAQADAALAAGRYPEAFAAYVSGLDMARTADSRATLTADKRVEELWSKVPDLPEATLDQIEAQYPAWETLRAPRAKAWEMRFQDARRRKAESADDTVRADAAAATARDMAWDLITTAPTDAVTRKAVQVYIYSSETMKETVSAKETLAEQAETLPPSPARFCIEYWAAQDAADQGDANLLIAHCRRLLDIQSQGALTEALNDPFADPVDKVLMEYHVAYAHFVEGDFAEALKQCDCILSTYTEVKDDNGGEHCALSLTTFLRAMAIARQATLSPEEGLSAYDAFLARYPEHGNCAKAWMYKGVLHEQFGERDKAIACYETACTLYPGSGVLEEAQRRLEEARTADGE